MFASIQLLERALVDYLNEFRFFEKASWVVPSITTHNEKIYDAIIVGAGQTGLALAYNLKLRGVRRIILVDQQTKDKSGPWSTFARMTCLRTPKSVQGLECGNPLLSFKAWFCSAYSLREYEDFDYIPVKHWRDYLAWYRAVLGISVLNNVSVVDIQEDKIDHCLRIVTFDKASGTEERLYTRKLCHTVGMAAAGGWAPPAHLVDGLPSQKYWCAWEDIDWSMMSGKRVAVIGGGASGFDNAVCALEAGAESVSVFCRRRRPEQDIYFALWRGRNDTQVFPLEADTQPADQLNPLLEHNAQLEDENRVRLLSRLFEHGRSPSNLEYLSKINMSDRIAMWDGVDINHIHYFPDSQSIRLTSPQDQFWTDQVIFATGPRAGLERRPELKSLKQKILTWKECVPGALPLELGEHPKLTENFQLQSRDGEDYLKHIYSAADLVHSTVGKQSTAHLVTTIAKHLSFSLYQEQISENIDFIDRVMEKQGG